MNSYPSNWQIESLDTLINRGIIKLNRGDIISKRDIAAHPGDYPIYSSAKENNGMFGRYGKFMFDEEVITWSIDGGGRLFYREKQKFSVTNVGGIIRILDRSVFDYKFLFYALTNLHSQVIFDWSRKAHPSVIRLVYDKIPIPPLPEQHKIVEILEDHLSRLDAAIADVKQAKAKAAQFRRSLLQAAFSGNLESDATRFMTVLPVGWKTEPLANLLSVSIGGIWGEECGSSEVDVSVVRVTELKAHGRIDPSTAVKRSVTQKQLTSRELQEGDLLLEKSGGGPNSPVGRVGYFYQEGTRTVCSNFMQLMRPDSKLILPKYLFYFLDGFHSNGGTIPMQTATTNIRNIKTPQYMEISVPHPPLPEQHKIVEILEDHLSRLDASVTLADAMEKQSTGLRRSLLQAAFTGQLTNEVASV
jgi:restriction endonuclease S subunit